MNKNEFIKNIEGFRLQQYKNDKNIDLLTLIYRLAAKYDENTYLEDYEMKELLENEIKLMYK